MRDDRRKAPRVVAKHLVSYSHFDSRGEVDEMGMARTLDLSEGGIVLEMTHALSEGDPVGIKMITGEHILEATGTVVYSKRLDLGRWRVGLRFTGIANGDLAVVADEVTRSLRAGGGV